MGMKQMGITGSLNTICSHCVTEKHASKKARLNENARLCLHMFYPEHCYPNIRRMIRGPWPWQTEPSWGYLSQDRPTSALWEPAHQMRFGVLKIVMTCFYVFFCVLLMSKLMRTKNDETGLSTSSSSAECNFVRFKKLKRNSLTHSSWAQSSCDKRMFKKTCQCDGKNNHGRDHKVQRLPALKNNNNKTSL